MSGPAPDSPKARMPIETKAQLIEELASGSKPNSCKCWRLIRFILLMVSIMCTGIRMVRA